MRDDRLRNILLWRIESNGIEMYETNNCVKTSADIREKIVAILDTWCGDIAEWSAGKRGYACAHEIADRILALLPELPLPFAALGEMRDKLAAELVAGMRAANELDTIVHALGVEDSDTTPEEKINELYGELEKLKAALASGPVMQPLLWGPNEFGDPQQRLMIGGLYIGEIQAHRHTPETPWRAWFSDECEGNGVGLFATADLAREAVERKFRDVALTVPALAPTFERSITQDEMDDCYHGGRVDSIVGPVMPEKLSDAMLNSLWSMKCGDTRVTNFLLQECYHYIRSMLINEQGK